MKSGTLCKLFRLPEVPTLGKEDLNLTAFRQIYLLYFLLILYLPMSGPFSGNSFPNQPAGAVVRGVFTCWHLMLRAAPETVFRLIPVSLSGDSMADRYRKLKSAFPGVG